MTEISFEDYDPEEVNSGGLPKPGKAHFLVTAVEERDETFSYTSEIIAHEDETQVGRTSYNIFNKSGKGSKRALLFALACGLITKKDLAVAKAKGTIININFEDAYSKTFCGTLVKSKYLGKDKCRVEWDFCDPTSKDADDYPKNSEFVATTVKNVEQEKEEIVF